MTSRKPVRVGTRGSALALAQTNQLVDCLRTAHPGTEFEVVVIRTTGDEQSGRVPARTLGKGLFTREIEEALLSGCVDLAVHSLKDLPTTLPTGLVLGAVPLREDPRDAMVGMPASTLRAAPKNARVGTSSLRRAAQLRRAFPGCTVETLRGNLDTRLRKVAEGVVDAAVLAAAGLRRLGITGYALSFFEAAEMLPAPGQGALALEIRREDPVLSALLKPVHCAETGACVTAERAFLAGLGGGCQVPIAALGSVRGDQIVLSGRVLSTDGAQCVEESESGAAVRAEDVGRRLAERLLSAGAADILAAAPAGPAEA